MNNDQLKESSLFGRKEGEASADTRFVVGRNQRLESTRKESLEEVHNLSEDDSKNLQRVMGRLKVKPTRAGTKIRTQVDVAPISIEDAERTILSVFSDPNSTDTLFIDRPGSSASDAASKDSEGDDDPNKVDFEEVEGTAVKRRLKPSRSTVLTEQIDEAEFLAEDEKKKGISRRSRSHSHSLGDESSVPTLESNSTVISSQAPDVQSNDNAGPFASVESNDLFEKVATVKCTVCNQRNIEAANYCARCGSLLKFGLRQPFGFNEVSKEPTAMSWTPNQELKAYLIAINDDGTEGKRIPVEFMETIIGRETDSPFPTDSFLSPKHAKLLVKNSKLYIQDLDSLNGTFVKLRQEKVIQSGDTFLMGRQVLSFEETPSNTSVKLRAPDGTRKMGSPATDSSYRLLQIGIGGVLQNVYCLPKSGAQLGRERGDIIFPHDKFMSSRHAQIYRRNDGEFVLADLNSSNGTWIKIWELTPLETQDYIFMGQQLFRVLIDR